MTITPDQFWQFVEEANWKDHHKEKGYYDTIKLMLMKRGREEAGAFREYFNDFVYELRMVLDEEADNNGPLGVSDDGFSDLTAHIVGLGKEEYEAVLEDPTMVRERVDARDYTEGFQYSFPYDVEFDVYSFPQLTDLAQRYLNEYDDVRERLPSDDLNVLVDEIQDTLRSAVEGDWETVISRADKTREYAESLSEDFRDAVKKLLGNTRFHVWDGSDVATNKWAVWNLLSDVEFTYELDK